MKKIACATTFRFHHFRLACQQSYKKKVPYKFINPIPFSSPMRDIEALERIVLDKENVQVGTQLQDQGYRFQPYGEFSEEPVMERAYIHSTKERRKAAHVLRHLARTSSNPVVREQAETVWMQYYRERRNEVIAQAAGVGFLLAAAYCYMNF